MPHIKRGWHNPLKYLEAAEDGKCPYCHKHVKSLKDHVHDKHKSENIRK